MDEFVGRRFPWVRRSRSWEKRTSSREHVLRSVPVLIDVVIDLCSAALTLIAGSPLKIDLRPVLPDAVPILASFLRKNQRALKLCTLAALDILLRNYR